MSLTSQLILLAAAPEISGPSGTSLQPLNRSIDVWSLGCVFSLAVTWLVLGPEGIFRYQLLRENAQNVIQDEDASNHVTPPAAFHDGENLLEDVRDWHRFLKFAARRSDHITDRMIDLIEEKMLVPQASHRMQAAEIYESMRAIILAPQEEPPNSISLKVLEALVSSKISDRMTGTRDLVPSSPEVAFSQPLTNPPQSEVESKNAEKEAFFIARNNSFLMHKHEPLSTSSSIRLVTLYPASDSKQEIICEINQFKLDRETIPSYEAVSWIWGVHGEHDIKIMSGYTTFVRTATPNLTSALKSLRGTRNKRVLWIDALCIDMENLAERNNQIMMMSSIFGMAQNVCVWLGEADSASDIAFDFIRDEVLTLQGFDELCEDPVAVPKWRALHNLMGREWFQRRK